MIDSDFLLLAWKAMGTAPFTVRVFRFGAFAVDARTGELTNAGQRTPLRDQPLQLLLALLERPGELEIGRASCRERV